MRPLDPLRVPLSGTQLIEASAGTGKTYTITTLVVRLLLEAHLRIDEVLVVTFTNAATAELKDRIRRRLREAADALLPGAEPGDEQLRRLAAGCADPAGGRQRLLEALRGIDQAAVFTIHGFCQRVLQEHAFESGARFDLELMADTEPLITELVQDFWARELHGASRARLDHLRARKKNVAAFVALARIAAAWPEMPVVPETAPSDPDPALPAYRAVRTELVRLWRADRAAVVSLLCESPALKRNIYRPASVQRWALALDAFAAAPDDGLDGPPEVLERFGAERIGGAVKKGHSAPKHAFFELCDRLRRVHLEVTGAFELWLRGLQQELIAQVRRELPARKRAQAVQSFDDLLHDLDRALAGPRGGALAARLRERFPAALIDEFQDTDPVQYAIFRRIHGDGRSRLFLIGDPKQAIYAFRGADVFAYLAAADDARAGGAEGGGGVWTLGTSYRSDPAMVRAVNAVFGRSPAPFLLDAIRFADAAPRPDAADRLHRGGRACSGLRILYLERTTDPRTGKVQPPRSAEVPGIVAAEISRLLASGTTLGSRPVEAGDVAVLTRSNHDAREMQRALRALRIPSVLHGDASVFDSEEAVELGHVLRALAEPSRPSAVRTALTTSLFGVDAADLFALCRDEAAWERRVDTFHRWHELWERRGFVQALRALLREEAVPARVLRTLGGERRLTNLLHLVELLHQQASSRHLGAFGLLRWYEEVRQDGAAQDLAPDAAQIRLESDEKAVQLTTVHRSKGLEYPIVYCSHLWRPSGLSARDAELLRYHDPNDGGRLKLDLRPAEEKPEALELAEREARSEALRLAYVALTRARHRTVVVWGALPGSGESALAHLLHGAAPAEDADDRTRLAELRALAETSGGVIEVTVASREPAPERRAEREDVPPLEPLTTTRRLTLVHRTTSYSALTAGGEEHASLPALEGRDVDAVTDAEGPRTAPQAEERLVPLHDFPRGARAGDALHSILERIDFGLDEPEAAEPVIRAMLEEHGLFTPERAALLGEAIPRILHTPLGEGFRLADVPAARRLCEMEFTLPVAHGAAAAVTAAGVARVLAAHGRAPLSEGYAGRVARLGFAPFTGFLRGFIDLVFEHGGRFYVADYKSNFLGPHPADYAADRLIGAMEGHHYFLQYHLYLVALHRHLGNRLPGYDYDAHMGGALYLFLRGMDPEMGPERGVFFDRPPRALIEGLSEYLNRPEPFAAEAAP